MPFPLPPEGRGFSADDLYEYQSQELRKQLETELPKLKESALQTMCEYRRASEKFEALKVQLQGHLGGPNVKVALDVLNKEAEQILKAEKASQALAANKPKVQRASAH